MQPELVWTWGSRILWLLRRDWIAAGIFLVCVCMYVYMCTGWGHMIYFKSPSFLTLSLPRHGPRLIGWYFPFSIQGTGRNCYLEVLFGKLAGQVRCARSLSVPGIRTWNSPEATSASHSCGRTASGFVSPQALCLPISQAPFNSTDQGQRSKIGLSAQKASCASTSPGEHLHPIKLMSSQTKCFSRHWPHLGHLPHTRQHGQRKVKPHKRPAPPGVQSRCGGWGARKKGNPKPSYAAGGNVS